MDLLFIIYIFVLFVLFSPNFLLKSHFKNHIVQSLVHGMLFSILFYLTYSQISYYEKEGLTIGTYETSKNNNENKYNIETNNSLGVLVPKDPSVVKEPKVVNNEIIMKNKSNTKIQNLVTSPPYDYVNFRSYDYENMKKRIELLDSHKHSNQYYDLVPHLGKKENEILCAADYGTNVSCCRQPNAYIPDENVCGALKPYCVDYIDGKQWGKCVENNPHPKPNLNSNKPSNNKTIHITDETIIYTPGTETTNYNTLPEDADINDLKPVCDNK